MPRRLALAAVAAALPQTAPAQTGPSLWDFIQPDRIVQRMLQSGVMALRTQMDFQYDTMGVDLAAGRASLTGIELWPLPEWEGGLDCRITADRMTIRSAPLDDLDHMRFQVQVFGAAFGSVCFPREPRQALSMLGLDNVSIPHLTLDVDYEVSSSATQVHLLADVTDMASVDLFADFSYLWFDGREDMDEPKPVAFLSSATLAVENYGLWQRLAPQLPPQFTNPDNAAMLTEGMLGSALAQMNREAASPNAKGDTSALSKEQNALVASAKAAWPVFLADPQCIVLETRIDDDVFLNFEEIEDDPRELFRALRPVVALKPASRAGLLDLALLQKAMGEGADALTPDERRSAGLALVRGNGAPRNVKAGLDLLGPLGRSGDRAAALALAEALELGVPEDAYRYALVAASKGEIAATGILDRIEDRLPLARILQLQNDVTDINAGAPPAGMLASVPAMRKRASERMNGVGWARSYPVAAIWAMLARAAGDPQGASILDDIDEIVRLSGPEAVAAWAEWEARASARATEAWVGNDMPATLGR